MTRGGGVLHRAGRRRADILRPPALAALVVAVSIAAAAGILRVGLTAEGQEIDPVVAPFPPDELSARRAAISEAIGDDGIALIQGAPTPPGYVRFRQSNEMLYLAGIETPHAYLLIEGASGASSLYLPPPDARREASEGATLSSRDVEAVRGATGVDHVRPLADLYDDLRALVPGDATRRIHTPLSPPEGLSASRDIALRAERDRDTDPWDEHVSRHRSFVDLVRRRFPEQAIVDLSPTLDRLRLIKSPLEVERIREATRLAELALMEAMRSVRPGTWEHEIDALAKFVFFRHGAQGVAYYSLVASGPNAWYPHYHRGARRMRSGELLLIDIGPDFGYYTADVTRMVPVDGRFNDHQRDLYGFYLAFYRAILNALGPGPVAAIRADALREMDAVLRRWEFSKPVYESAAKSFVDSFRSRVGSSGGLGHWVGMAVHDVGPHDGELRPGMVFTIEPQFRVPEERIYLRLEDMIVVTENGAEVLSSTAPLEIDEIEATMAEDGLLERYPRLDPGSGER